MPETTPGRRTLRFATLDDALNEAERLAAAEREGRLERVGQWTLGQTLGHLAAWIDYGFEGFPAAARPALPLRLLLRLMRNRVLSSPMPSGIRLGNVPGGTVGIDPLDTDEGLRRYRAAVARLKASGPTHPSPVFGALTQEQAIQLNLRHAELHLSFQVPRDAA